MTSNNIFKILKINVLAIKIDWLKKLLQENHKNKNQNKELYK